MKEDVKQFITKSLNYFHDVLAGYGYTDILLTKEHLHNAMWKTSGDLIILQVDQEEIALRYQPDNCSFLLFINTVHTAYIRVCTTIYGEPYLDYAYNVNHMIKLLKRHNKLCSKPGLATI